MNIQFQSSSYVATLIISPYKIISSIDFSFIPVGVLICAHHTDASKDQNLLLRVTSRVVIASIGDLSARRKKGR